MCDFVKYYHNALYCAYDWNIRMSIIKHDLFFKRTDILFRVLGKTQGILNQ